MKKELKLENYISAETIEDLRALDKYEEADDALFGQLRDSPRDRYECYRWKWPEAKESLQSDYKEMGRDSLRLSRNLLVDGLSDVYRAVVELLKAGISGLLLLGLALIPNFLVCILATCLGRYYVTQNAQSIVERMFGLEHPRLFQIQSVSRDSVRYGEEN